MAEIINLRRARKAKQRVQSEEVAAQNRVRFGRTRQEVQDQRAEAQRQARLLDGAKRETD